MLVDVLNIKWWPFYSYADTYISGGGAGVDQTGANRVSLFDLDLLAG